MAGLAQNMCDSMSRRVAQRHRQAPLALSLARWDKTMRRRAQCQRELILSSAHASFLANPALASLPPPAPRLAPSAAGSAKPIRCLTATTHAPSSPVALPDKPALVHPNLPWPVNGRFPPRAPLRSPMASATNGAPASYSPAPLEPRSSPALAPRHPTALT